MQVDLLGVCAVRTEAGEVAGAALGGRRARVALAALALADGTVRADVLAERIWGDDLPATWQPALRGVIRGLRQALAPIGADGTVVVATAPSGYRLADGVAVDADLTGALRHPAELLAEGRYAAALAAAEPVARARGAQLLPDVDASWLTPRRAAIDAVAAQAGGIVIACASALGEHARAVELARLAVGERPLDEPAHRTLIGALVRAGDRAGAVRAYEQCRSLLAEHLGVDPSRETVDAYLDALADLPAGRAGTARPPTHTTSFVGRADEIDALSAAIGRPGLVTLRGRGGVGKSRLAALVAAAAEQALWVALSTVGLDDLVVPTVALALDVSGGLADHLAPLGRTLLVLDGGEAVLDGVASLAAELAQRCPLLTVLITSRTAVGVDGEQVLDLDPLPEADQRRLLAERSNRPVAEDPDTQRQVATLCRCCDGLPLALELAAAQLADMSVGELVVQLEHVGVSDRLRAVARSSYELLATDEAVVFRRLGVLDGPVGLPLVRAVVAGSGVAPLRVVRILRELGVRGLVDVDRSGAQWRYQQDDDLHRFARELLVDEGVERAAFDGLADAIRALLPDDPRLPPGPFADDVTAVLGSLRSLFGAAVAGRADRDRCLELAFRLHRYWTWTAVAEGRLWLSRLLAVAPEGSPWTRYAAFALGYLSYFAGNTAEALHQLQAAIAMFDGEPDPFVARALIYVAGLLDDMDRSAEALEHVRQAMAAAEPFGADLYVAAAMGLGSVLSERGDISAARYAAAAVARCRADGSPESLAILLPTAGMVCWQVGALDEARAYLAEARPLHAGTKRIARVVLLSAAAGVAHADGDLAAAIEDGVAAETEADELGIEREMPLIRAVLARAYLAAGDLPAATACTLRALDVAEGMSVAFPAAICLETAALVAATLGVDGVGPVLAAAAQIRTRGERPAPATLAPAVAALIERRGAPVHDAALDAIASARELLTGSR